MKRLLITLAVVGAAAAATLAWRPRTPIRIGVLHSLTGTMAISERALVDAVQMAVDEINQAGGVLGRQIEPIVADGRSDPGMFAREAQRLITSERVTAIFGCWTSGSRRTARPIFEEYNHLLFYPVQYEGLENSANIVYLGAAPNQLIFPAVRWLMQTSGRR